MNGKISGGLKYSWNEVTTRRLASELDLDCTYGEAQVHDPGKCHEICGRLDLLGSVWEFLVGLLADTMHKSKSYAAPISCYFVEPCTRCEEK
jgi:hypothetical protein